MELYDVSDGLVATCFNYQREKIGCNINGREHSRDCLHCCILLINEVLLLFCGGRWEDVLEHEYALRLTKVCRSAPADQRAMEQMRRNPSGWSLAHYEQLAQLLSIVNTESGETLSDVGSVKQYIESLSVSSQSVCSICSCCLYFLLLLQCSLLPVDVLSVFLSCHCHQ